MIHMFREIGYENFISASLDEENDPKKGKNYEE